MTRSDRAPRAPRIPRVRRERAEVPASRGAHALEVVQQPLPGHLFLDPDVPPQEVIDLTCGSWTGRASHVWTGVGWARLVPGPVAVVPTARPKAG